MEFWDEVQFFKKEGKQRVQNYKCELSKKEFLKAYDEYVESWNLIRTWNYKEITEGIFLLKQWENDFWKFGCYIYKKMTDEFFQRKLRKIKKYDNALCVKIDKQFLVI
jgi:hypothetical protein